MTADDSRSFTETTTETYSNKTLRDEFAMAALTGILSNPEFDGAAEDYAKYAYSYAGAMMEARERKG